MHVRFRRTFLLTLVAVSLVAAPLAVTAADLGSGFRSLQLRSNSDEPGKSDAVGAKMSPVVMYDRSFAPVMESLNSGTRFTARHGGDWFATPSGYVSLSRLDNSPQMFRAALDTAISKDDVALVHFGDMPMDSVRNALKMAGVTPLGEVPNSAIVVTGIDELAAASLARAGATVTAWPAGFFMSDDVGITPVSSALTALNPILDMQASVFPGADEGLVVSRLEAMGASVQGSFNGVISFTIDIADLRVGLETLTGSWIRAMSERMMIYSVDEDTDSGIEIGVFRGGDRPYNEAEIDGASQIIGITDTGLSLDAYVFAETTSAAGTVGPGHRKIVAYIQAQDIVLCVGGDDDGAFCTTDVDCAGFTGGTCDNDVLLSCDPDDPVDNDADCSFAGAICNGIPATCDGSNTGNGDLLTCDGLTGATHGHVVASIAAGNASDLTDVRVLSGFEPNLSGSVTDHAVDGVAAGAKVYFIDDQVSSQCNSPDQIERQNPGSLSANVAASQLGGAKIHNFSFAIEGSEAGYSIESQDIDAFLAANTDMLVVVAAGNSGVDADNDTFLDFGTVTAPGTAKNTLTVGSSGYPNNALDPTNSIEPNITNNGIGIISRFQGGGNGSGQGPAAFTVNSDGGPNWRIKPDVMAPGDETLGNQRMTSPTTCVSGDDDQLGSECSRLLPGIFEGTSFAAAAVSGAAALVRDYFEQGFAPAGDGSGSSATISGLELKAALIASADLMVGNPSLQNQGGQLQLAFYNPKHLSTFTIEQGYGRVQLNKLLPLSSEPGTPAYIETELVSLSLGVTDTRFFNVIRPDEEMRCVVSWYDKESTQAGGGAQGNLVRNVDMVVTQCGAACGDAGDVRYLGNFFSEDTDFDGALLDLDDIFICDNDPGITCTDGASQSDTNLTCIGEDPPVPPNVDATCVFSGVFAVTEDCNSNGALDFGEFSLEADAAPNCPGGGVDQNNNNEAVFLSPSQLGQGDTIKVTLRWDSSSEASPPANIEAGLVCTGGIVPMGGGVDSVRLNKPRYTCADALDVTAIVPAGSTNGAVGGAVTVTSIAANGVTVVDTETGLSFNSTDANVFNSNAFAVVDSASNPPTNNDLVLGVETGGSIVVTFGGASASGSVRCTPQLTINNIGRRGINANFGISGGCDPRGTIDPRAVLGGLIPGSGTTVTGDLFMDANEDLTYSIAFTNQEEGSNLLDVRASLKACVAGSISGSSCTPAPGIEILDPDQKLGNIGAGKGQVVSFNVHVGSGVAFADQIQMVFGVTASKNGLTVAAETVIHHVLNVDNWSTPDEDPLVSGVEHFSSDFPFGGREIRLYAGEDFDVLNPDLAAEVFIFQDMTTAAFGGGNATVLGFNSSTGRFENAIANNMPWTFDLDDEAFGARRRFDSDSGDNLELQTRNVWQWNNTGECGFQSNDSSQADFQPETGTGPFGKGVGGMWHTGHAESMAGTPGGRTGYDVGCEDYDLPGSADPKRERVIDSFSSPIFFRVHQDVDSNGFAYQVEFTRFAYNSQWDLEGQTIVGYEIDPDTTTSQPSDPLDFGWLTSDQGVEGFLAQTSQSSYQVFNPNDPHESTSATANLADPQALNETPGPTQNIRSIQGPGSPGSYFEIGNPNKGPARSFGEIDGRGRNGTIQRGAGGFPVRNYDNRLADAFAGTFEDVFGPNETRDPDQAYPINSGTPEVLVNERTSFQLNFTMILREAADASDPEIPSYGSGIDDIVVEWRESHPIADRTPCSDPSTWALDENRNPTGGSTTCIGGSNAGLACSSDAECPSSTCTAGLASGCAVISWDRSSILSSEDTLTLTVIDTNAQFGPDGLAGTGDEQAVDDPITGLGSVSVPVNSEADIAGEVMILEQIALASSVYSGTIAVSSTKGLTSSSDGTLFIQENGDGTNPTAVNAQYVDQDINVAGLGLPAVPCPDNPLIATALTQFVGTDVAFVTALISDVGPNADGDLIADPGETIEMGLTLINSTLDVQRQKPDLQDVLITLVAKSSQVGPDQPIACILDSETFVGTMLSGIPADTNAADPLVWVVGNKHRSSPDELLQAQFSLGIVGRYTDSLGIERQVTSFATPQNFGINLDLDILPGGGSPLSADTACEGGTQSGLACNGVTDAACTSGGGTCVAIPAYLATGGTSNLAGLVGYFEGFEGATGALNVTNAGGGAIAGTGFDHAPAMRTAGGYLDSGGPLDIDSDVNKGFAPDSVAGIATDIPEGTSAVDGSRCQYNDSEGPSKHDVAASACRPWDGSDWHVVNHKAFSGNNAFYAGVNGSEQGQDDSWDTGHTNALFAAFSGTINVGVAGGATLSIAHIVAGADDRTFNVPSGNAVGRGILEWAIVDPGTGKPLSAWNKINGFQNNYGNTGVVPFFINCIFEGYDDFYDAAAALGGTPGFNPGATNNVGSLYNADNIGSEDDYFDPNDPLRLFGASHSCFPEFVFASLGDWTSSNPTAVGKAFTVGIPGETGTGIWIKSLFNLDAAAGRTIRVRYVWTDIQIGVGFIWSDLFGNDLGNAVRGWILDDMAVSGLVDAPIVLAVDTRSSPATVACPVDPFPATPANEAACGTVSAVASSDLAIPVSGSTVTLDAAASSADSCVNGHLEYQWRIGGSIVQDYSTNPSFLDAPLLTTQYTVTVRCSTDPECLDTDNVVAEVLDQREASGVPDELLFVDPASVGTGTTTYVASEPAIGGCSSMSMTSNDLLGAGGELRQTSPTNRSGIALGAALRADLCDAGAMAGIGGGQFSFSTPTATSAGEIDGYLAVGTCQGIQGTLGRLKPLNPELEVGRGGVPGGLPVCP